MDQPALSWRSRIWRWRWVMLLLTCVAAVRVALPIAVRYGIESQGAEILKSRVHVGNVDLWLLQGAVAIDDFALWLGPTTDQPAAAAGETTGAAPPGAGASATTPPLLAWKRLLVDIQWLPLWNRTVRLQDLVLDSPRVAVDRLEDGHLSYEPVLRAALEYAATEPPAAGTPGADTSGGATATPTPTTTQTVEPAQAPTPSADAVIGEASTAPTGTVTAVLPGATATPAPETPEGPGWQVGLDRIVIRDGHARFHDLMLKGSEPIDLDIPTVSVKDIALTPGLYGDRSRTLLHVAIDEGTLDVDARLSLLEKGIWLETNVEARNLPLRRSRLYIPNVGWSDLRGAVDLSMWYGLETGVRDQMKGTVTLRDVAVSVPDLTDSALAFKNLSVRLDMLDLLAHVATVAAIDLSGAQLTMRLYGDNRFPLLQKAAAAAKKADEETMTEAAAPAQPVETAAATPPGPAWQWSVASVHISDTQVQGLTADTPLDIGLDLSAQNLSSAAGSTALVDLALKSDVGSVDVNGSARIDPPGFGGTLKLGGMLLPRIVAISGTLAPEMLQSATLQGDLTIAAGMAAPGSTLNPGERDVQVQGKLAFAEPRVVLPGSDGARVSLNALDVGITELAVPGVLPASQAITASAPEPLSFRGTLGLANALVALGDGKEFSIGAKALDVDVSQLLLPGVLPSPDAAAPQPVRVSLGRVRLDAPSVRVTRTTDGIVLPSFSVAPPENEASSAPPQAPAEPPPTPPQAAPGAPPVDVAIDALQLTGGRVDIVDRAVKPTFTGKLSPIDLSARDIRWPELAVKHLRLAVTTPTQGLFEVRGDLSPNGGTLNVDGKEVALSPFNPYAAAYSPYRVAQGSLSLSTKVTFGGGRYDANNALTLHELDVEGGGGKSTFEKEFGIPVSMALALMRDTNGDIGLDIPVQVNPEGTQIDLLSVVGGALRRAILGALASPLKLFGAVAGGPGTTLVPASIELRPGRAEFAADGAERVQQLGALLESRPALAVEIDAAPSTADVRWLQEQALLKKWNEESFFAAVRGLTQREARKNVRAALEAHAKDEGADLSPEDAAALDAWLKELPPITAQQLTALDDQRLSTAEAALRDQGIDAARIMRGEPQGEVVEEPPALRIQLRPVTSP